MWRECKNKSEHSHHIRPKRYGGCDYDFNRIALCQNHHCGGRGIHKNWEEWRIVLWQFKNEALAKWEDARVINKSGN